MRMHEKQEKFSKIATAVTLFLALSGVAVSIFNYVILNQLQPLNFRVATIEKVQAESKTERVTLATKEQLQSLSDKIDDLNQYVHTLVEKGLR